MRRRKNKVKLYLLILLGLTIGFALVSTTLYVNGVIGFNPRTFDIHWDEDSIEVVDGSRPAAIDAHVSDAEKKNISFAVEFAIPDDFYEFTVDAKNYGNVDGTIGSITFNYYEGDSDTPSPLPDNLTYSIKYADGSTPAVGDVLRPGRSKKYRIRFEQVNLKQTSTDGRVVIVINKIPTKAECPAPVSFSSDSWDTIACNVRKRNTDAYNIGDTKSVDLGTLGTHTVRLANKSTPNECSGSNFSQTACGFVVEFTDIIVNHRFNPYGDFQDSPDGFNNKGGWKYSDIRAYMNNGLYEYEHINYETTGMYNKFPKDLRDAIIETKVVSGHGYSDTANFTTTDKLYLLGTMEVYGSNPNGYDTAADQTRQFDYYSSIGVTTSNCSGANKNGSSWWLRSVDKDTTRQHYVINNGGGWSFWYSNSDVGISPAFRIG